ncbi:hypothetical protein [Microcoleus sp. OTE_8_concoct_300]|uniref:hypothetical protein n=1 Tax=Microcoleus sp. OTE_8_concoct_300 TaxID=2964710 RepID=UPI00403F34A5
MSKSIDEQTNNCLIEIPNNIDVYWLQTFNEKYISVVDGRVCHTQSSDLSAEVNVIMAVNRDRDFVVLLTPQGNYLSAQVDGTLQADRKLIGPWEKFKPVYFSNDVLALLTDHDQYLCAELDGNLVANRSSIGSCENFNLTSIPKSILDELVAAIYPSIKRIITFGNFESEINRFKNKVLSLQAEKKPIKIYVGPGKIPKVGFLNIELEVHVEPDFLENHFDEIFQFPANSSWSIPDCCVDYIFHEDFIEHISQQSQIEFLAEAYRVLKPGAIHRISTPCLIESMRLYSDFEKGFQGVFSDEWKRWSHINLFSKKMIEEIATMIGYKRVHFTVKNHSLSEHHPGDWRPGSDRDENFGNIYVELLKTAE